ncbi:MAG: DUF7033 domain-containing protein, partial [Candidatus Acidiferrales bacterium]
MSMNSASAVPPAAPGPLALHQPGVGFRRELPAGNPSQLPETSASTNGRLRITPQARAYAIWELARRAGVPIEFFRIWQITVEAYQTVVEPIPGNPLQICFPHATPEHLETLSHGVPPATCRKSWVREPRPGVKSLIPDLIVPFVQDGNGSGEPLFVRKSVDCWECTVDLPLSIILSLSRWEELGSGERDVHGRFTAGQSVSHRDSFVHRPIVDEYGLAFEQVLQSIIPSWQPAERCLGAKVS